MSKRGSGSSEYMKVSDFRFEKRSDFHMKCQKYRLLFANHLYLKKKAHEFDIASKYHPHE